MQKTYNVCIVYARKDAEYLEELRGHLRPMERNGMLKICSERKAPWRGRTGGRQYSINIIYTFASKVE
jgi:hypothetical protein